MEGDLDARLLGPLEELECLSKPFRIFLMAGGAVLLISALVNIVSVFALTDSFEESSLGVSRNSVIFQYGLLLVAGSAMLFFGARRRK